MPIKLKKTDIENIDAPKEGYMILGFNSSGELVSKDSSGNYRSIAPTVSTGNFVDLTVGYLTVGSRLYGSSIGTNSIAQGSVITAAGTASFAQGLYAISQGDYSRARGENILASGAYSYVSGKGLSSGFPLTASGAYSFVSSYATISSAAMSDYSVILGGQNHNIGDASDNSVILGGIGNNINASIQNVAIIASTGVTATLADTVYVPRLILTNSTTAGFSATTTPGTIQWDGTNFKGYKNSIWYNLDEDGNVRVPVVGSITAGQIVIWNDNTRYVTGSTKFTYDGVSFFQVGDTLTRNTFRISGGNSSGNYAPVLELFRSGLHSNYITAIGNYMTFGFDPTSYSDVDLAKSSGMTLDTSGNLKVATKISVNNGIAALPSYSFNNDTTTGLYYTTNTLGVSVGGITKAQFNTTELELTSNLTFSSGATRTITVDTTSSTSTSLDITGQNNSVGNGGNINIAGGTGGGGSSTGGNVNLHGGTGYNGGDVFIYGGPGSSSGDIYLGSSNSTTDVGRVYLQRGTALLPGIAFRGATTTGLYYAATYVGVSVGGVANTKFDSTGVKTIDGSAAAPSYSFTSNPDTGIYYTTDKINIGFNGVGKLTFDGYSGITVGTYNERNIIKITGGQDWPVDHIYDPILSFHKIYNVETTISQMNSSFTISRNPSSYSRADMESTKNFQINGWDVILNGHNGVAGDPGTNGSPILIHGGDGGVAAYTFSENANGGDGSTLTLRGGNGGDSEAGGVPGDGGDVNINAGSQGSIGIGGNPGSINLNGLTNIDTLNKLTFKSKTVTTWQNYQILDTDPYWIKYKNDTDNGNIRLPASAMNGRSYMITFLASDSNLDIQTSTGNPLTPARTLSAYRTAIFAWDGEYSMWICLGVS